MADKETDNDLSAFDHEKQSNIIRKTLVTKLIAFIQLYAIYIIIFGEMGLADSGVILVPVLLFIY